MTCQKEGTRHTDISTWEWRRGPMHIANLHSPGVRGSPAPLHIQSAGDAGSAAHPGVWEGPGISWFSKTPPESLMCELVEIPLLGSRKVSIWLHFSDLDGQHSNLYVTAQASQPLGFRGPRIRGQSQVGNPELCGCKGWHRPSVSPPGAHQTQLISLLPTHSQLQCT